jgi:hypothetical protein
MNANNIINDTMTLEEKLAAIDKAVSEAEAKRTTFNPNAVPVDPATLTICDGCE